MKNLNLTILILFVSLISKGQNSLYNFKSYQINDGLSSNTITAIIQDKKGFMWFGSRNGLSRFDGTRFRVFRSSSSTLGSLGSNAIQSLYEDNDEKLWVGTSKGIYIYNPVIEKFKALAGIPKQPIQKIYGDGGSNVWILSEGKIYHIYSNRINETGALGNNFTTMCKDKSGRIWASSVDDQIIQLNSNSNNFKTYRINKSKKSTDRSQINEIHAIGDSALIIAKQTKLVIFNYKTGEARDIFYKDGSIRDLHALTIFQYAADNYWIGTEKGLYILTLSTGKITTVQKQYGNPYSITDNVVSTIYRDRENGVWLGTYFGGVNYYSTYFNLFQKYIPQPGSNPLNGNLVHEIVRDKDNYLWIGTEDGGLNKLNLKSNQITSFTSNGSKNSISYNNVHGLCVDNDKLWIGTYEHGLDVMELKTGNIIKHYDAGPGPNSFNSNFIVTIYKDIDGEMLIGTWSGLYRYNRKADNFSPVPFFNMQIQSIYRSNDGTLWVGSYGNGVIYHNQITGKNGRLLQKNGLANNYVNHIFKDSHNHFWFSTENGLTDYDPVGGNFKNYSSENGLPSDQVFRVVEDENRRLWISTGRGLASYDLNTKKFGAYHVTNGLPTEQFNYNSSYMDASGNIYFGTVKGMVRFNPSAFIKNTFVSPVYITGLQVNNKDEEIGEKSILKKSIIYSDTITLPHDSANLNFDVVSLSYVSPETNKYQYKLEGFDKDWITINNNRRIYYTNLPPGSYIFRVKGSNNDGIWNDKEKIISIRILNPWWLTWWAYSFYAIVILGTIITILKYYHQANSEKNKRRIEAIQINTERELYNAKIEFFTNVAHEIRTPLTLIKMPLDKLENETILSLHVKECIQMIKKNTSRLIDLTNQLLDFRKTEVNNFSLSFTETRIQQVLDEVYTDFKPAAEIKNLSYTIDFPRHPLFAFVDKEAFKKILSNLFSNAIKYAATKVVIRLLPFSSEDTHFYIEFSNDGRPIEDKYHDKIFEPFFRIKDTDKEIGTGIGLPLARSLAILHNGGIRLRISDEGMNVFLISLPLHQEMEGRLDLQLEIDSVDEDEPLAVDPLKPFVLLVEDNTEILNYVGKELKPTYNILKAANGMQAMEMLKNDNIHLIVSDIMMPVMDGIEFCKRVKNDLNYSHIPVILLTAKNSISAKTEGLEVGADAYIEKPFSLEHLFAQISSLLNNRKLVKEYFKNSPLTHFNGINISKPSKDFLETLNKVIYQHITEDDLDVGKLSSLMNMSRPTLYRKIKGLSDLSPNELINLTRLKKAAELISNGDHKINEVAFLIGYSSPANFSRDFQKQFNLSPSAYLNKLRKDQTKNKISYR